MVSICDYPHPMVSICNYPHPMVSICDYPHPMVSICDHPHPMVSILPLAYCDYPHPMVSILPLEQFLRNLANLCSHSLCYWVHQSIHGVNAIIILTVVNRYPLMVWCKWMKHYCQHKHVSQYRIHHKNLHLYLWSIIFFHSKNMMKK